MNTALPRVHAAAPAAARVAAWTRRRYAFQAAGAPVFDVFNRKSKWLQRERAAAAADRSRQADYLKDEVAIRLCERLLVWPS